jgi:hypothetical protein
MQRSTEPKKQMKNPARPLADEYENSMHYARLVDKFRTDTIMEAGVYANNRHNNWRLLRCYV